MIYFLKCKICEAVIGQIELGQNQEIPNSSVDLGIADIRCDNHSKPMQTEEKSMQKDKNTHKKRKK